MAWRESPDPAAERESRAWTGCAAAAGGADGVLFALSVNPQRTLRHLDDADLDRLLEAVGEEVRRRGTSPGKTAGGGSGHKPDPVAPGQKRLILAAGEAGLKPAEIARDFASAARVVVYTLR